MAVQFIESADRYGYDFITDPYIPKEKDEYYIRNEQYNTLCAKTNKKIPLWRHLTSQEINALEQQGNTSSNWNDVLISSQFNTKAIHNSSFYGLVRIGNIGDGLLHYHDFTVPEGISNSRIISCDIGNHCAIHNCTYLSHYIISDTVILSAIGELAMTNHCKFGSGIIKEGEHESVRIWIDPLNEAGGRSVLPFYDMICADAYMWTIYRDDTDLIKAFVRMTQNSVDPRRGVYGFIGNSAVIKNSLTIKDVWIEESAYIKGANKIKNVYIKSSEKDTTQIGEGVELVNGIIGYGCHIFYGSKAVRFVMGNNSNLKYGARLIHSILGDNSTISCCEVLNNLVFPGHEQHHNNSFLIATLIMGQSNMAAGATVGSNHNSRGNDGEIIAGRGFWPGLSSTLKHNCRFASFTLITKGNYPHELIIPLPFSMLIENTDHNRLEVMPAYWWLYNMYALERNSWKYTTRDKRVFKVQHIETDYLAPDSVSEILHALSLLERWTGQALLAENKIPHDDAFIQMTGRDFLRTQATDTTDVTTSNNATPALDIYGENMERSKRRVKILKPIQAYRAYHEMLLFYGIKTLLSYFEHQNTQVPHTAIKQFQDKIRQSLHLDDFASWINLGGQLVRSVDFETLRTAIKNGVINTWQGLHAEYDRLWSLYPLHKAVYALLILYTSEEINYIDSNTWNSLLDRTANIRRTIETQVYKTKAKDYTNIFRDSTYRNTAERSAVLGTIDDNAFIKTAQTETISFLSLIEKYKI